jgi:hypothetical protein
MNAAAEGMDFSQLSFADVQQAIRRFIDAQRQSLLSR